MSYNLSYAPAKCGFSNSFAIGSAQALRLLRLQVRTLLARARLGELIKGPRVRQRASNLLLRVFAD